MKEREDFKMKINFVKEGIVSDVMTTEEIKKNGFKDLKPWIIENYPNCVAIFEKVANETAYFNICGENTDILVAYKGNEYIPYIAIV